MIPQNPSDFHAFALAQRKTRMRDEEARLQLQCDVANRNREEIADLAVRAFELTQNLRQKWLKSDFDAKH
jgi:site-specific DNA recombinase